jgi:hypothetical protein
MRTAIAVLGVLLLTSGAVAQSRGSPHTSGGTGWRGPIGSGAETGSEWKNDTTITPVPDYSEPQTLRAEPPNAIIGGGGGPLGGHSHAGHGHADCHDKEKCSPRQWVNSGYWYNGQWIGGYWKPGECWTERVCN